MPERKKSIKELKKVKESMEAQKTPFDDLVIAIEKQKMQIEKLDATSNEQQRIFQRQRNELDKEIQRLRRLLKYKKELMQRGVRRG